MLYCQLNLPHSNLCSRHALAQNPSMIHHCFTQLKSCCSKFLERFSKAHLQPTSPTLLSLPHRILSAYCAGIYTLCFHKCQNTVLPTFYSSKSHKLFQTFPDLVTWKWIKTTIYCLPTVLTSLIGTGVDTKMNKDPSFPEGIYSQLEKRRHM